MFPTFCLCLYSCARASGGLTLIARQASKCLLLCGVFSLASDFAWQLITIRFITLTYWDRIWFLSVPNVISSPVFSPLTSPFCCRMFGFVARRTGSATENVCHLFAEMDPEQPAVAIVNFINKVMLGPQLRRWDNWGIWKVWTSGDLGEMLIWILTKRAWLHLCLHLYRWHHCARLYDCFYSDHCSAGQSIAYMSVYRANH